MEKAIGERIEARALASERRTAPAESLGDARFRALLGAAAWAVLPPATRRRFSKRLVGSRTATYTGEVVETRMSRAGWLPATTAVMEDEASGGQLWTRIHGRRGRFPQVIRTAKRFAGPTGLEEYLGHGIGMALALAVEGEALRFRSAGYFLELLGRRMALPRWLGLPHLTVSHIDCSDGWFAFVLDLSHPILGEMIHQTVLYAEPRAGSQDYV